VRTSRELGVNSLESGDEAVRCDQKTQLCPTEHSFRSLVGSALESVEWLPNRGRESGRRTLIATTVAPGGCRRDDQRFDLGHFSMLLWSLHRLNRVNTGVRQK
jgi:hypothetical protein